MKCPKCGKNNPADAKKCIHCKTALVNNQLSPSSQTVEAPKEIKSEKVMSGWRVMLNIILMVAGLMAIAWIFSLIFKP